MVQRAKEKLRVSRDEMNERRAEHWMQSTWRPLMAIQYMITCLCDFVIFPILWSLLQAYQHGAVTDQWDPITLSNGGMYHMAMGAIIGISAWGRTKEKVDGVSTLPAPAPAPAAPKAVPQADQPAL
jgi:hypothetical protein